MSNSIVNRLWAARRYALASGWAMGEYLAYPLMMFAATPLFLHLLGTVQYGQWMLLLTFTGFGGIAGLGMGPTATKEVSAARGRDDLAGAADIVRTCLAVTGLSSLALSCLLMLFGLLAGPELLGRMGEPHVVRAIVVAAAMMIALEQIDTVFAGTIRGMERFDLSARLEVIAKFAIVLASLAAAWLTRSLFLILWVTVALTILRALAKAVLAARLLQTSALWPRWQQPHVANVFAFGKWTWAQSFGSAMFATADRLIVGSVLGADALARYSVVLQLAQQIQTVPAAGAQVLFPMISRRTAMGEDVRSQVWRAMMAVTALSFTIALPVIFFRTQILTLWVGPAIAASTSGVLVWLALGFALLAANNVPHFVLMGLGRANIVAGWTIAAGMVAVAISTYAVPMAELNGAAFARLGYAIIISALTGQLVFALRRGPSEPGTE